VLMGITEEKILTQVLNDIDQEKVIPIVISLVSLYCTCVKWNLLWATEPCDDINCGHYRCDMARIINIVTDSLYKNINCQ
jgi:hypothetical protein